MTESIDLVTENTDVRSPSVRWVLVNELVVSAKSDSWLANKSVDASLI